MPKSTINAIYINQLKSNNEYIPAILIAEGKKGRIRAASYPEAIGIQNIQFTSDPLPFIGAVLEDIIFNHRSLQKTETGNIVQKFNIQLKTNRGNLTAILTIEHSNEPLTRLPIETITKEVN